MISKGSYSTRESTPAYPAAMVKFHNPFFETQGFEVEALIDSGASGSLIPDNIADQLALQPINTATMKDYRGNVTGQKPVYYVKLVIDSLEFLVNAAETEGQAIIGRDILNKLNTTLFGIQQKWEMNQP